MNTDTDEVKNAERTRNKFSPFMRAPEVGCPNKFSQQKIGPEREFNCRIPASSDGFDASQRNVARRLKAALRPQAGRQLPAHLRVQNVVRLAEALPAGVRDAEFERLIARIDTGPIHRANNVEIYTDGDAVFGAILNAIEAAKHEILLETYILKDDQLGHALVERLGNATARGVTVRVLAMLLDHGLRAGDFGSECVRWASKRVCSIHFGSIFGIISSAIIGRYSSLIARCPSLGA